VTWRRSLKNSLSYLGALLLLVTIVPPTWYGGWLAGPWSDATAPVLIVLGGDSVREGMMGTSSYWRCVFAVDVWNQGGVRKMILSGDDQATRSMRAWILGQGVPAEVVMVENRSQSTRENALFTAVMLRNGIPGPYMLLTSDIHMWRARRAFAKAGLTIVPRAAPDAFKRANDWRDRWRVFLDIDLECAKIAYYRARSWI